MRAHRGPHNQKVNFPRPGTNETRAKKMLASGLGAQGGAKKKKKKKKKKRPSKGPAPAPAPAPAAAGSKPEAVAEEEAEDGEELSFAARRLSVSDPFYGGELAALAVRLMTRTTVIPTLENAPPHLRAPHHPPCPSPP